MVSLTKDPTPGPQAPPESVPSEAPTADDLTRQLEAARREKEELFQRLQYLQADFENFRKRTARDTETILKFAHEALVARLLPVLDDFDAALAGVGGDSAKGLRMVYDNLVKALREAGLQEIPSEGQAFDPYVHDAVQRVPDPELEDGTVKEVVRKGYRLQDRILRPAQVVVVKNEGEAHG